VGFFGVGFLGGCTQKTRWVFWVRTRVSEPWFNMTILHCNDRGWSLPKLFHCSSVYANHVRSTFYAQPCTIKNYCYVHWWSISWSLRNNQEMTHDEMRFMSAAKCRQRLSKRHIFRQLFQTCGPTTEIARLPKNELKLKTDNASPKVCPVIFAYFWTLFYGNLYLQWEDE